MTVGIKLGDKTRDWDIKLGTGRLSGDWELKAGTGG